MRCKDLAVALIPLAYVARHGFIYEVLYRIDTNRFWRVKFLFLFAGKPCNTAVLLRFPSLIKRNFTTTKLLCT